MILSLTLHLKAMICILFLLYTRIYTFFRFEEMGSGSNAREISDETNQFVTVAFLAQYNLLLVLFLNKSWMLFTIQLIPTGINIFKDITHSRFYDAVTIAASPKTNRRERIFLLVSITIYVISFFYILLNGIYWVLLTVLSI